MPPIRQIIRPPTLSASGALLFVLLLVAVTFANGLRGPFQFDDLNVIVNNPAVHGLAAWGRAPLGIRPLLKLSYALNWQLAPTAFAFHLANLGIHLLNTGLLFGWLYRVVPGNSALRLRAASMVALLWAVHPAQTEAVTYICGRSVSLMTLCWLAALLAAQSPRWQGVYWAAGWTALALAVRETAWVIPFSLLLVAYLQGESWAAAGRRLLPVLGVVALAALVFLLDGAYRQELVSGFAARPLAVQLPSQINALHYFLSGPVLALVPNIDPDIALQQGVDWHWLWQASLWLVLLLMSALACWRQRSWLAGGLLWFLLALLPTNSLFPRLDLASDRHLYPALIGPALALGLWQARWRHGGWLAALLVIVLAMATLIRNEDYRSSYALWLRTAGQSPHKARVWNNLGYACAQGGDRDCARQAYSRALALDPQDSKARLNLYFLDRPAPAPSAAH